jgi:hypothetical protein
MPDTENPQQEDRDEPVKIGLDAEEAIRALLKVDPDAPPAKPNADEPVVEPEPLKDQGDALNDA